MMTIHKKKCKMKNKMTHDLAHVILEAQQCTLANMRALRQFKSNFGKHRFVLPVIHAAREQTTASGSFAYRVPHATRWWRLSTRARSWADDSRTSGTGNVASVNLKTVYFYACKRNFFHFTKNIERVMLGKIKKLLHAYVFVSFCQTLVYIVSVCKSTSLQGRPGASCTKNNTFQNCGWAS